jgi:hypothetical protein
MMNEGTEQAAEATGEQGLTLKRWDDLTEVERSDLTFLRAQLGEYERILRGEGDQPLTEVLDAEYALYRRRVKELEKEIEGKIAEAKKALAKMEADDRLELLRKYYRGFLAEHEIYYVASLHLYLEYFIEDGKWEEMRPEALHKQYAIRGQDELQAFDDVLDEQGRKKISVENSFYPKSDRVLNQMRRDHWIQPQQGKPHYMFELLLKSLANGQQENIDHIEQLVYWKYTHPEEYKLPCLIIYGEGGAGKNTFVKDVLGTIFGPHQVLVADAEKALGQFNGLIQGKVVVMIDEAIAEKVNVERLKRTVGNRTVDINPKYGKQGEHDNTAMYLAGGNETTGPILLAGDATDRRWSIIKVERTVIQRLMEDKGCTLEEAVELYKKMERVFTDRRQVGRWLNSIMERWQDLELPPSGLHKDAYQDLLAAQRSPFEELMELVFVTDMKFEYIAGPVLFKLYERFSRETNPSARGVMQRNKFYSKVRDWLKRNTSGISWGVVKIRDPLSRKLTSANAAYTDEGTKTFEDNEGKYLPGDNIRPFWETVMEEEGLVLLSLEGDGDTSSGGVPTMITPGLISKISSLQ